jgi:exodeoxyribonuclease-3
VARAEIDVHSSMRNSHSVGQRDDERDLFRRLLADGGLVDLGRAFDPDNDGLFTWWPPWREERRKNRGWRLDDVLASTSLASSAASCRVLADFGTSDHAPVEAEFLPH